MIVSDIIGKISKYQDRFFAIISYLMESTLPLFMILIALSNY